MRATDSAQLYLPGPGFFINDKRKNETAAAMAFYNLYPKKLNDKRNRPFITATSDLGPPA
jgi:hypothetical protein